MFSLSELKNTERGKCDHLLAYSRQTDMRRVVAWLVDLVRFMCSQNVNAAETDTSVYIVTFDSSQSINMSL